MSIECIDDLNDVVNVLVDGVTHGIKMVEETGWRFSGDTTCNDDASDSCKSEATKHYNMNDNNDVFYKLVNERNNDRLNNQFKNKEIIVVVTTSSVLP